MRTETQMKKALYNEAVDTLKNTRTGHGKDVAWHLLNGTEAYKHLFYELVKLVEKNEDGFWIHKKELSKRTKLPYTAMHYPLYKFEKEDLLSVEKNKIIIQGYQVELWEVLCGIIRSSNKHK